VWTLLAVGSKQRGHCQQLEVKQCGHCQQLEVKQCGHCQQFSLLSNTMDRKWH